MHGEGLAGTHLPWIYASLQCLSSMRVGDPIQSTIDAIQTTLKKIHPSYEWEPQSSRKSQTYGVDQIVNTVEPSSYNISNPQRCMPPESSLTDLEMGELPMLSDFQGNPLQGDIHPASVGSDDLLDLTISDMGWDFDFYTMDLEAFFSVNPSIDAPVR
ncbi:hypothetical protein EYZ11_007634 [Aspergillus tanneri]|uniref:Uncharacterized protein n=1 Tax=Aspergillus tanneri TaxID=1220188 RepID=A0A4S3JCS8_9EURO|nr:hypothetical protein EYZ11_007634 [Aspergillus tanneri]